MSQPTGQRPGRPAKPAALRLLQGNPGKRPVEEGPAAPRGPCPPPEDLSPPARARWDELADELEGSGLLTPRYAGTFAAYCESYAAWRRSANLVAQAGPVVNREGTVVSNPASREFARFALLVRAFGSEFGLSPGAVTGLARVKGDQDDGLSPSRLLG